MRRFFAGLAAALLSTAAAGEWTAIGHSNGIYTAYADRGSIRYVDGLATMHSLFDFARQDYTPEGRGLYSTAVLKAYDCGGHRTRLLSAIDFAGRMGAGGTVSSTSTPGRWEAVVPGGIDDAFWQIACSGR